MHHDVGGDDWETIDPKDKKYQFWERQVHALLMLLVKKNYITVTELRRGVEHLLPEAYGDLTYYERWTGSMVQILIERGVITDAELEAELGPQLHDDENVKFSVGDIVRVRDEEFSTRWRKPHLRTPGYIFGVVGTVVLYCGLFHNPQRVAFRQEGAKQPLYKVRFRQADVWPDYEGGNEDCVDADVYQHWLEPSTPQMLAAQHEFVKNYHAHGHEGEGHHHHNDDDHGHHHHHDDKGEHHHHHHDDDEHGEGEHHHHKQDKHHHGHSHGHHHRQPRAGVIDHGDHTHEARMVVEQNAVEREGDDDEKKRLAEAFIRALIKKGVITADELRQSLENVDGWGSKAEGPRIVARAWVDPDFKKRLLVDAADALKDLGIPTTAYGANNPNTTKLVVCENTPKVHNLVVCTLCSCYPLGILGLSPPWYKSRSYRARAVRDPRGTLRVFGTEIPDDVSIIVHDSTADMRYLVLPQRPAGTENWTEEQLQKLVNRDSMIGVTYATSPAAVATK